MKDTSKIKDKMDVVCSCGTRIGRVDHVDGDTIKLMKNDPVSGGKHHMIPTDWVDHVDSEVVLSKNSAEAMREWKEETIKA